MNESEPSNTYAQQKYTELWGELKSNLRQNAFLLEKQAKLTINPELVEDRIITMYLDMVFSGALYIYDQALQSFQSEIYEGAATMCRTAVDSALYEAITRKLQSQNMSVAIKNGTIVNGKFNKPVDYYWENLKHGKGIGGERIRGAVEIGILSEDQAKEINGKIRDKGNFSAHFSERVDKEFYKSNITSKNNEQYKIKLHTTKGETEEILTATRSWLVKIICGYFDHPQYARN